MANTEFGVLLKTILDSSSIGQDDITKIQKVLNKYHLNLSAELDDKQLLNTIKTIVPQLEKELKKITGVDIEINDKDILKAITQINKETQQAVKEQESLANAMAKGREQIELTRQAEEKRQQATQNKAINKALEEEYNLRQKNAEQANKIQLSTDVTKLTTDYQKFGVVSQEVENNLKELKSAQQAVINAKGTDKLTSEIKKYDEALAKAKSSMKELTTTQVSLSQRTSQMTSMQEWMRKNKAATKLCGDQVEKLIQECKTCDAVKFDGIKNEFKELQVQAGKAGKLGSGTLEGLIEQGKKFVQWIGVSGLVMEGVQTARQMYQAVIDVNSAMIELRKVSDASDNEIKNYFDEAAESAKKLGSSISDVINATADFSRLGYNLKDASVLAEVATLYKNVGDGITIDEASSSIVSTMKAFGIEAENAMQIIDSFNEVGNNFAISSGEIGDALKRSASSLAVGGNSLSEAIGLITAGNTVVQDADTVGTALKSMSLRITSTSAELEAMGEDTEFACETLSDYRDLVMGLTDNKVNIVGDNGEYKSTYEILKEISKVWDDMNSMEQSSLMKALFGVRQANIGASILENFDVAEEAMKAAEESAGSALKEQENYEKGIRYSIDRLIAKFQELSNHILDSKLVKGVVDFGTTTLDVIDKITSALTPLGTIGVSVGIGAFIKNFA